MYGNIFNAEFQVHLLKFHTKYLTYTLEDVCVIKKLDVRAPIFARS